MYQLISESDFRDAFVQADRKDQFSYEALTELYNYYESVDFGEMGIELDVIAICCDWTEYADLDECRDDYPEDGDDDDYLRYLQDNTIVLELDNGGILIQNF